MDSQPDPVAYANFNFIWLHNPEEMQHEQSRRTTKRLQVQYMSWYLDLLIEREVFAVKEVWMCFVNVDELFAMRERPRMQIWQE
jgi:hypothetical protein